MNEPRDPSTPPQSATPAQITRPTSDYTDDELAQIYNQARVDYIVPMPMNGRRMREYITHYDIDLDASMVAIDPEDDQPNGICMLGVRDQRSWITRLGVIPHRRRRHTGQFLMNALIDWSQEHGMQLIQLEVITGNEPAYKLFTKLGFEVTRELMIIRRPPSRLEEHNMPEAGVTVTPIDDGFETILQEREAGASWVEESVSLLNAGNLKGYHVTLPDGESGWVIFQRTAFQLTHFVFKAGCSGRMQSALLAQVHSEFSLQDTKIENVPVGHPTWDVFKQFGYVESFRRLEMFLYL